MKPPLSRRLLIHRVPLGWPRFAVVLLSASASPFMYADTLCDAVGVNLNLVCRTGVRTTCRGLWRELPPTAFQVTFLIGLTRIYLLFTFLSTPFDTAQVKLFVSVRSPNNSVILSRYSADCREQAGENHVNRKKKEKKKRSHAATPKFHLDSPRGFSARMPENRRLPCYCGQCYLTRPVVLQRLISLLTICFCGNVALWNIGIQRWGWPAKTNLEMSTDLASALKQRLDSSHVKAG